MRKFEAVDKSQAGKRSVSQVTGTDNFTTSARSLQPSYQLVLLKTLKLIYMGRTLMPQYY